MFLFIVLLKLGVSIIYIRMKRMKTGDFEVLYAQTPQNTIKFLTLFSFENICLRDYLKNSLFVNNS